MRRALIIGVDSTIGNALKDELSMNGWLVYGTSRKKTNQENVFYLDLTMASDFVFESPIDVVYLCAGITSISACEKDVEYSKIVNIDAQIILASYFIKRNVHVIYLSSNAVFDGLRSKYKTTDDACPNTVYGRHKASVENYLSTLSNSISIVRLTKVLTKEYPLILQWIMKLGNNEQISAYQNLYLSPVSVNLVVSFLKKIAEKKYSGIIHLSGIDDVSYFNLAQYIARSMRVKSSLVQADFLLDVTGNARKFPIYASLDIGEAKKIYGVEDISYKEVINDLYGARIKDLIPC